MEFPNLKVQSLWLTSVHFCERVICSTQLCLMPGHFFWYNEEKTSLKISLQVIRMSKTKGIGYTTNSKAKRSIWMYAQERIL